MPFDKNKPQNYALLYNNAKEAYKEEQGRGIRADEKSSRLMTILSGAIGFYAVMAKWLIEKIIPPHTNFEWFILSLGLAEAIILVVCWHRFFSSLRTGTIERMPFNETELETFDTKDLSAIHRAYTETYIRIIKANEKKTTRKLERTASGYSLLEKAIFLLLLLFGCYVYQAMHDSQALIFARSESRHMAEDNQGNPAPAPSQPPPQQQPAPTNNPYDVKPPEPQAIIETFGDRGKSKRLNQRD